MTKRLMVVAAGTFFLFSVLIFQFYKVQVIEHEKWKRLAHRQHEGMMKESFRRGTFYSNAGLKKGHLEMPQTLAIDIPKLHLHADPSIIPEGKRELIAENLRLLAEIDAMEALEKKSRNRRLKMWLTRQEADRIREWWFPFAKAHRLPRNALFFVKDYQRAHPFGKLLGQALHTVRDHKEEKTAQGIPTGGLEAMFHSELSGKLGSRWMYRSPRHSLGVGTLIEEPEDGADVYLTIHPMIQAICEEEIERGVLKSEAKGGWAIVMDPHSGEILALAQYPFFNPNCYRDYFNDEERVADTLVKGVTYAYEPGSVMKPLNLAIALSIGFDPDAKVAVSDGHFPGRRKVLKDPRPHSYLNANLAVQKSSNIYFGRLVERLLKEKGAEWYIEQIENCFGLGKQTGIELPGEACGLVPQVGSQNWSGAAPWSLAMGYNLMVTSFQMLRAHAVIANDGKLIQPTLIKRIVKEPLINSLGSDRASSSPTTPGEGEGEIVRSESPIQVLDPKICQRVRHAMRFTTKRGGSAPRGNIPFYTDGGKSGTAEKVVDGEYSGNSHFCSFIGFTPAEKPQFLILIAIDEPNRTYRYGGTSAAPVFREIGKRIHDYCGTARNTDRQEWTLETGELLKIYEEWNCSRS